VRRSVEVWQSQPQSQYLLQTYMILYVLIRGNLCIPFPSVSSFDHRLRGMYMHYTFDYILLIMPCHYCEEKCWGMTIMTSITMSTLDTHNPICPYQRQPLYSFSLSLILWPQTEGYVHMLHIQLYLTNCTLESIARYINYSLILWPQTERIYC
jgi:hypothetical protein